MDAQLNAQLHIICNVCFVSYLAFTMYCLDVRTAFLGLDASFLKGQGREDALLGKGQYHKRKL